MEKARREKNLFKILIVEDHHVSMSLITDILEESPFDCYGATTAHEARLKMEKHEFDIIIMDILLPDGNGLELVREYRATGKKGYIIGVTGMYNKETQEQCFAIGFNDVILKPFRFEDLLKKLNKAQMKIQKMG
ncbi:MAG: response regulator [Bacteroidales bacterium]|nr:response regulator [Bacteroidales bacterium]